MAPKSPEHELCQQVCHWLATPVKSCIVHNGMNNCYMMNFFMQVLNQWREKCAVSKFIELNRSVDNSRKSSIE